MAFISLLARVRPRHIFAGEITPSVTVIVAAYNEEHVIERRILNLLELDYPSGLFDIVVTSDASTDKTNAIVERLSTQYDRVSLIICPRGGKVAAQDRAVRQAQSEVVAFSDANTMWLPNTLRLLVRPFADSAVSYVCGRLKLESAAELG